MILLVLAVAGPTSGASASAPSAGGWAARGGVKPVVSAVLAIVLWPLVLFGVNLHIK